MAFNDFNSSEAKAALDRWITRSDDEIEAVDAAEEYCFLCGECINDDTTEYMEEENEGDVPVHADCLAEHRAILTQEEAVENKEAA